MQDIVRMTIWGTRLPAAGRDNKGLDLYMPDNFLESLEAQTEEEKRYDKSQFEYDEEPDTYRCLEGKPLSFYSEAKREDKEPLRIYRGEECGSCSVRARCTRGQVRTVTRDGREGLMETMRQKLKTAEGKKAYQKRMYTVEPVLGNIQGERGKIILSLRGWVKVKGEWLLMCLACLCRPVCVRTRTGRARQTGA